MNIAIDSETEAIILGLHGTLVHTEHLLKDAIRTVFRERGVELSTDEIDPYIEFSPEAAIRRIIENKNLPWNYAAVVTDRNQLVIQHIPRVHLIPGTHDLIHTWSRKMPLAVGTNESFGIAGVMTRVLGIKPYIQALVTIDEVSAGKPDPEIFLLCARHLNISPSRCQVVEGSDVGIEAARRAGMKAVDVRSL